MKIHEVKQQAFCMPFHSPSYSKGPYRFKNREFFIIKYETDIDLLRAAVPEPLIVNEPYVLFEFISMPDSYGFGSYQESGQVIPVEYKGKKGNFVYSMYLDDLSPIVGGREIWGFPKKYGNPNLKVGGNKDCIVGTLDYGEQRIATASMAYKYETLSNTDIEKALSCPNYLLKIIPHVDGSVRICELVEYFTQEVHIKGAWTGPTELNITSSAQAPLAKLPIKKIISGTHFISDLTLAMGKVVYDYLKD